MISLRQLNKSAWLVILFFVSTVAVGAEMKPSLSVSDNSVTLNDQIQLTIDLENADQFPTIPMELDGFDMLSGPSQSSSFQMINGRTTSSKKLIYLIAPTKTGRLTIGPLKFNYKGKTYTTNSVTVRVNKSGATASQPGNSSEQPPLILQAEADRKTAYTGQQISVTYRLLTRLNARSYNIDKQPNAVGFWSEEIPTPKEPTGSARTLNGIRYNSFIIKRTAYFPTESGTLHLDPLQVTVEVQVRSNRRNLFDDFFSNDPFFGRTATRHIESNPVEITVNPIPRDGRPDGYEGAVGQFTLQSSLDTSVVHVDEAVGVTLTLEGTGNISTIGVPSVPTEPNIDMFDPEVKKSTNIKNGLLTGTIKYQYVFIPREAGDVKLPEIQFSYFDPSDKQFHVLDAGTFRIKALPLDQPETAENGEYSREEVKLLNSDIRYLKPRLSALRSSDTVYYKNWVFYALALLSIVIVGGSIIYNYWWDRWGQDAAYLRRRNAEKRAKQRLHKVEEHEGESKYYGLLNRAVLGYIGDRCNIAENTLKTEDVAQFLQQRSVPDETVNDVRSFLTTCDAGRFAPGAQLDGHSERLRTEAKQLVESLGKYL